MNVRHLRREYRGFWRVLCRIAVPLAILEVLLLGVFSHRAEAATQVAYVELEQAGSYRTVRRYAGKTLPGRVSELGFKQAGQLNTVLVDVGDRVDAGTPLAHLDAASLRASLRQARAEVAVAAANVQAVEARAQLARQTEARYASLQTAGHVSLQAYDEQHLNLQANVAQRRVADASLVRSEAARAAAEIALQEATLIAPFSGTVQARHRDEGSQLQPGQSVLRLVEARNPEAHVGVPERVAADLQVAATYPLRYGNRRINATLLAVLPEVDDATRTLTAVFRLEDSDVPLGVVVELEAAQSVAATGFWVPLTALTESDRGLWGLFVIADDATVERHLVEVLHAESGRAFVRGTLADGDRVVRTGVQRLVPGQRIDAVSGG